MNVGDDILWQQQLNFEDILHDAGAISSFPLFQTCIAGIFPIGFTPVKAKLLYETPIIIPRTITTKPNFIHETHSIRDTEKASNLYMDERYTPAYYFDPAVRTFPAEFPDNMIHNTMFGLSEYGLDLTINITFEKSIHTKHIPDIMAIRIETNSKSVFSNFIDNHTVYIDNKGYIRGNIPYIEDEIVKSGYIRDNNNSNYVYFGFDHEDVVISGNTYKTDFFNNNNNNNNKDHIYDADIVKKGQRLILYKLLGDLLHLVFSTDDDLVFTVDSYLRDRCIKKNRSCVVNETNIVETSLKDGILNVYYKNMFIDNEERTHSKQKEVQISHDAIDIKLLHADIQEKFKTAKGTLTGKEQYINHLYNNTTSDKVIRGVKMYNYYQKKGRTKNKKGGTKNMMGGTKNIMGGTKYEEPFFFKIKNDNNTIGEFLVWLQKIFTSLIKLNAYMPYARVENEFYQGLHYFDGIIEYLLKFDNETEIGFTDKFKQLIKFTVDKNILFEGHVEDILLNVICGHVYTVEQVKTIIKISNNTNILNSQLMVRPGTEPGLYHNDFHMLTIFTAIHMELALRQQRQEEQKLIEKLSQLSKHISKSRNISGKGRNPSGKGTISKKRDELLPNIPGVRPRGERGGKKTKRRKTKKNRKEKSL